MIIKTEITEAELKVALKQWLERRGLGVTDQFSVTVRTTPGDRPCGPDHTSITLVGLSVQTVDGDA